MTDTTDMSLMSTMQDSQASQSSQASQNSQAHQNDQASFGSVNDSFRTTPTGSMSPKIIMGVLGGCVGLMVIALVVVIVYFVVVKSCTGDNSGGGSGGGGSGGGGGGGSGGACPMPSTTTGVACTANADLTYSCVENCAALTFPAGSGCTAKPNATTNLCDITCAAPSSCTTESFDASNPRTWVQQSSGNCVGTAYIGGDSYCDVVPELSSNHTYTNWAKVKGKFQPLHMDDGLKAVAGSTDVGSDWTHFSAYCQSSKTSKTQPCTGLDVFYDQTNDNTYYVPCLLSSDNNQTGLSKTAISSNPYPFENNVTVQHYGPVIAQMFTGQPPQPTTTTKQPKKLPGW